MQLNQDHLLRFLSFLLLTLVLALDVAAQNNADSVAKAPVDSAPKRPDTQVAAPPKPATADRPQPALPAQATVLADTTVAADTTPVVLKDSISWRPLPKDTAWQVLRGIPFSTQILQRHPYYDFNSAPVAFRSDIKVFHGKEMLFYAIVAFFIIFALLRLAFAKYFNDMFRVFFRTTMKQRQIREQLIQTPLPSLLLNMFFVASAGLYIVFVMEYFSFRPVDSFWLLYLYACIGLCLIYIVKFIGLKICGWLFNMKQAADSYIFIVFIINKMIGLFLLPLLPLFAFSGEPVYSVTMMVSWVGIAGLLLYRFILGYSAVRNEVRFNLFHFFLYICAFEVAPLLLIYRGLLFFFK